MALSNEILFQTSQYGVRDPGVEGISFQYSLLLVGFDVEISVYATCLKEKRVQ
jgi:hypothetical protein